MLRYAKQKPPSNISKHYTPKELAAFLVSLVPLNVGDVALDPCAGSNKAFYAAFPCKRRKCEIEEGIDFLETEFSYDWAITNPPYHLLWRFIDKISQESRKGFGLLVNINGVNTLTPKRLALLHQRGFTMRRLHVCNIKQWFGRYYFYVFSKQGGACKLTWDKDGWK